MQIKRARKEKIKTPEITWRKHFFKGTFFSKKIVICSTLYPDLYKECGVCYRLVIMSFVRHIYTTKNKQTILNNNLHFFFCCCCFSFSCYLYIYVYIYVGLETKFSLTGNNFDILFFNLYGKGVNTHLFRREIPSSSDHLFLV